MQVGAEAFRIFAWSLVRSFPAPPMKRVVVVEAGEASANQSLAGRRDRVRIAALERPASSVVAGTFPPREAPCSDPGRRRRERGQTGPESATRESRDPSREKQSRFGVLDGSGKVMVAKGLSPAGGSGPAPVLVGPDLMGNPWAPARRSAPHDFRPETKRGSANRKVASVHHRRLEDTDHGRVRRFPAQIADAVGHIAAVAQRLAGANPFHRSANLDLQFAIQSR